VIGFIDTAKVYTPQAPAGDYTVLAQTLTGCRLAITPTTVPFGGGRLELTMVPRLLWTDSYVMPGEAQIEVAGTRYNVKAGTYDSLRGPSGAIVYRRVDVEEL